MSRASVLGTELRLLWSSTCHWVKQSDVPVRSVVSLTKTVDTVHCDSLFAPCHHAKRGKPTLLSRPCTTEPFASPLSCVFSRVCWHVCPLLRMFMGMCQPEFACLRVYLLARFGMNLPQGLLVLL